jgi:hypothetical protein
MILPVFRYFLAQLAKARPATAIRFLKRENPHLASLLPDLRYGIRERGANDDYQALLRSLSLSG